jgi:bisphosphoglycerate-dependent phosphoglycerate mutase
MEVFLTAEQLEAVNAKLEAQHRKTWALAAKIYGDDIAKNEGQELADYITEKYPCPPIEATKDK